MRGERSLASFIEAPPGDRLKARSSSLDLWPRTLTIVSSSCATNRPPPRFGDAPTIPRRRSAMAARRPRKGPTRTRINADAAPVAYVTRLPLLAAWTRHPESHGRAPPPTQGAVMASCRPTHPPLRGVRHRRRPPSPPKPSWQLAYAGNRPRSARMVQP
jgi:hypothetical protein